MKDWKNTGSWWSGKKYGYNKSSYDNYGSGSGSGYLWKDSWKTTYKYTRKDGEYMDRWEKIDIGNALADYYSIFSKFWSVGTVQWKKGIGTALIKFDKTSSQPIKFQIDPVFWESLNEEQRCFIVCHEMQHVVGYHGFRFTKTPPWMHRYLNIALDIVVNESLVADYGFSYDTMKGASMSPDLVKKLLDAGIDPNMIKDANSCFVHNVFKHMDPLPPTDKDYSYYLALMLEDTESFENITSMDSHEGLESFMDDTGDGKGWESEVAEGLSKREESAFKELTKEQIKDAAERKEYAQLAGREAGEWVHEVTGTRAFSKKKWESVIKQWKMKTIGVGDANQWRKIDRRYASIIDSCPEIILPCEEETDRETEEKRITVWFFQDTSGSCAHLANRFFAAAESLPRQHFDVKLHCFDTRVYETNFETKKLYGFGGTCFNVIEQWIQSKTVGAGKPYPDCVFVITDGHGTIVQPQMPDRWHWFLSEKAEHCIPQRSPRFMLADFE